MKKFVDISSSTSLITENDNIYSSVFTKENIAAYAFDPRNKENSLTACQKSELRFFVAQQNPKNSTNILEEMESISGRAQRFVFKTFLDHEGIQ